MTLDYYKPEPDGLFNQPPLARTSDPKPSHAAAEKLVRSGKQRRQVDQVVEAVRLHPGLTYMELAALDDNSLGAQQFSKRIPDARNEGRIECVKTRECTVTKLNAATWRITKHG